MSDISKRLPLSELEKTREYQRLTPKQKLFVATYCEGGLVDGNYDAVAATQTAYGCKSLEVARVMSYTMMQNMRIIEILNRHFNAEPIEDFLIQLERAIHNKKLTVAQLQALRLKCEILGFVNRLPGDGARARIIPPDVQEATKEARKAARKTPERKPREKTDYEKEAETF